MNQENFFTYAIIGVAILVVGSLLDISSSKNFSSYNGNMREANPLFRLPNGDCDTRKNTIYSLALAGVLIGVAAISPKNLGLAVLMFGTIIGALRAVFALRNWSAKKKFGLKKPPVAETNVEPSAPEITSPFPEFEPTNQSGSVDRGDESARF
jgi:prepilin signal peptidase PulO-like enzyme (type II secretory pathway)